MTDQQLESFKTDIPLPDYAAQEFDYQIDQRESYRHQLVMRTADKSDKIGIARMPNNHWCYYSFYNLDDHGTIIDFLQNRRGGKLSFTLAQVRQELAQWSGYSKPKAVFQHPEVKPIAKGRFAIMKEFQTLKNATESEYLQSRAIGKEVLRHPRFLGQIKVDSRHNVVFPHYDLDDAVCGLERKNWNFNGFTKGGRKSVWVSNRYEGDQTLVICESVIDCLSFHLLYGDDWARYVATSGQWSPLTVQAFKQECQNLPGSHIILGFDNDAQGKHYVTESMKLLADLGKCVVIRTPIWKDWNEELKNHPPVEF